MSFDLLAPHYRWMEWLLAGPKLQRCRTAFLRQVPEPRHALLLGEGNGRFLVEFVLAHPGTRVTCLDASEPMLASARARLQRPGLDNHNVEFVQADIFNWSPPREAFDLVVSHFFLDCFRPDQLEQILPRVAAATTPEANWLLADFREPPAGWARWRARLILRAMYLFFRRAAGLPAARLTLPDPMLQEQGFALRERRLFEWGLLHSDLWTRGQGATFRLSHSSFA